MAHTMPETLRAALRPVTVVAGHYGAGKTNFSVNLTIDLAEEGNAVSLVDLDIVNPYFRASEQRAVLEEHGINLVAPVFAEAGTSLDVPSLTGRIGPAIESASAEGRFTIIDVGGDDVGATALGRFSKAVAQRDYALLYIANRFRNLVQDPDDAVQNLREIESACRLCATAVVSNAHLKDETDSSTVLRGRDYARDLCERTHLPLVAVCVSRRLGDFPNSELTYVIDMHVRNPWE